MDLEEASDTAEAREATAGAILPEEEEMEEVDVIPEEVNINNKFPKLLMDLDSSTSEMEPELNIIHLLTTLKRYSTSSLEKRKRC